LARVVGLQTSRGCAEFGRREREATRLASTCYFAGYFKRITAVRDTGYNSKCKAEEVLFYFFRFLIYPLFIK